MILNLCFLAVELTFLDAQAPKRATVCWRPGASSGQGALTFNLPASRRQELKLEVRGTKEARNVRFRPDFERFFGDFS